MVPPPEITSQRICAPSTARPPPSATVTTTGCCRGCPATPDCSSPEEIARPVGSRPIGSTQLPSMAVLSSIPAMEKRRRWVIRGRIYARAVKRESREPFPALSLGQTPSHQLLVRLLEAVLCLLTAHPRDELVNTLSERHLGLEPQQPAGERDVRVAVPDVTLAELAQHVGLQVRLPKGGDDQVRHLAHSCRT